MQRRLSVFILLLQLLPATAALASDSRLTQTALAPVSGVTNRVVCRIVTQPTDTQAPTESASRPVCIHGLPENLCSGSMPWPTSGAIDVQRVARCEQGDCILDTASETGIDCAGLTIQPRYPRQPQSLEARH